jgi:hypothetical protein
LLLSQLLVGVLKVERRHWVIFVSAAVFSLSLKMALERWLGEEEDRAAILPTKILSADEKNQWTFFC